MKNVNVFLVLFVEKRHRASYLGYFPSIHVLPLI